MADVVPDNFLGLPHDMTDYRKARFAVLPVPYDSTTSYAVGTREGPRAIITAIRVCCIAASRSDV